MQLVEMLNGKELSMKREVFAKKCPFHRRGFNRVGRKRKLRI